ncbi:hypothetical protein JMN32_04180 [Fulvivirga sp. 29W222]|uniref:Uncharacterized protein n=1 Tax=Fulvivirga marina TaxID=2494733 RepID=A0A937FW92_9BACT|nr:hypothetical protein [Fulvivirga marina]MBL6445491.1 hypothetical protein [Fulvivirga marina]
MMMTKSKMGVGERERLMLSDNFLMEKVRYILNSPSQCEEYKRLTSNDDKVNFFLNHFIMNDYAIRQMKNLYLSSEHRILVFLDMVENIIHEINQDN